MQRVIPAVLFFLFICWVILQADSSSDSIFFDVAGAIPYGDKVGHILLYGVLTSLTIVAVGFRRIYLANRCLPLGAVMVFVFAAVEEISQIFLPNRTFDMIDLCADLIGVVLFSLMTKRANLQ